jgi:ATP/maltotriose-dependent transcriptional regulator MalT
LALLQEEIEDEVPKIGTRQRLPQRQFSRQSFSPTVRPITAVGSEDKSHAMANKLSALKAYRKATHLCFTCGEKFAPGHKCSTTVQLHVVEELLAMLNVSDSEGDPPNAEPEVFLDAIADHQNAQLMSISKQAFDGSEHLRSMRLVGNIQGHEVLILIDSGSSNNFISAQLAAQLQGVKKLNQQIKVKVAGGGILTGDSELPDCTWTCQDNTFCTSLKVLPLQ